MNVQHLPARREFTAVVDGATAYLRYDIDDGRLNIRSTYVPTDLRGRGIARELVEESLRYAETEGLKAEASCSYAAAVIERRAGRQ